MTETTTLLTYLPIYPALKFEKSVRSSYTNTLGIKITIE